jgi:hypothetical protein
MVVGIIPRAKVAWTPGSGGKSGDGRRDRPEEMIATRTGLDVHAHDMHEIRTAKPLPRLMIATNPGRWTRADKQFHFGWDVISA